MPITISNEDGVYFTDKIRYENNATAWDDVLIQPVTAQVAGARTPNLEVVANDGSGTPDKALLFDGNNDYCTVPDYDDLDTQNLSVSVWIKPTELGDMEILDRENQFEIYTVEKKVRVKIGNSTVSTGDVLIQNGTHHIVITVEYLSSTRSRVKIYVNGRRKKTARISDVLSSDTTGLTLGKWYGGGWYFHGIIDALYMYNVVLSDDQIAELYNDGEGTGSHPTGITESTDVIAKFEFNEGTGTTVDNNCTLGDTHDMTINGATWTDGLLNIQNGSFGIVALAFPPNVITEIFFSVQLPHAYKEGTNIHPHVHWAAPNTNSGNIVWKLEYMWININEQLNTNTSVVSVTVANDTSNSFIHRMTDIPDGGLDGTGKTISSVINGRFYRDGTDSNDTYSDTVYVAQLDIHYMRDANGSQGIAVKDL